jgi:hypothetical protein
MVATRTASVSGNWNDQAVWGGNLPPADGDTAIINEGVTVLFNVDQSSLTGLASLVINGILHFKSTLLPTLKMNGSITGTGSLIVGEITDIVAADPTFIGKTPDYENVYETRYEGVRDGYLEKPIIRLISLYETMGDFYKEVYSLDEVESTPKSFMRFEVNNYEGFYFHTTNGESPSSLQVINSIKRPAAGSEFRTQLLFNASGTINVPIIVMGGWYPDKEYTTLDADADSGQAVIVLNEGLDLQAGDKIAISNIAYLTNFYRFSATEKGLYTVQSYNAGTKTVTLTSNLLTNRIKGDYVAIYSRPINLTRSTTATTAIIPVLTVDEINCLNNNGIMVGVCIPTTYPILGRLSTLNNSPPNSYKGKMLLLSGWSFKHCTGGMSFGNNLNSIILEDCTFADNAYGGLVVYTTKDAKINRCIIIGSNAVLGQSQGTINDSIILNTNYVSNNSMNIIKNCIIRCQFLVGAGVVKFSDCDISSYENYMDSFKNSKLNFVNCRFKDNGNPYFENLNDVILNNCLFENDAIPSFNKIRALLYTKIESFDHNQLKGNYKAWMKGGKIESYGEVI